MQWHHTRAALAGALLAFAVACTTANTSLVGPTDGKCQIAVGGAPNSFGATGGGGAINVTASRDCTWSITGTPAWVSINGESAGQGNAVVPYAVAENPVPFPRAGTIAIGTEALQVSQAAAPCRYGLSRADGSLGAAGGHLTVDVSTLTGCNWSATSDVPWVIISSGSTGDRNGTVGLDAPPNTGAARSGTVRIAGEVYTLTQSGADGTVPGAPSPAPAPPSPTPPSPAPAPPPAPSPVQFEGTARNVAGKCPALTFSVSGRRVATSRDTRFDQGSCNDLEKKDRKVQVTGIAREDGTIDASRVVILGKAEDD